MTKELEDAINKLRGSKNSPIIAYFPACAMRFNAAWRFMSEFDLPRVLVCDEEENMVESVLSNCNIPETVDKYPDLLRIHSIPKDHRVIRDDDSWAFHDPQLNYENRLIYRTVDANKGIEDLPYIDLFYMDYWDYVRLTPNSDTMFGYSDPDGESPPLKFRSEDDPYSNLRRFAEVCHHIRDGGLLIVEKQAMFENIEMVGYERRGRFGFNADGSRKPPVIFGGISVESLCEYDLWGGSFPQEEVDRLLVFKIHKDTAHEGGARFLRTCFVDINWD